MNPENVRQQLLLRFVPPVAAVILIVLFVSLGRWQLDRAAQKEALQASFANDTAYTLVSNGLTTKLFDRLKASGRYLGDRQFLIDNMVVDSQLGYFVITPFEFDRNEPLLLINRGWIVKPRARSELPEIEISAAQVTVAGMAGRLPRVAIRPGDAFAENTPWPQVAVFPSSEDLAMKLDRDVLPFVLLLNPDPDSGLVRRWQPTVAGPMTHYGYAFQWFAMALAVLVILVWQYRKKNRHAAEQ